MTQRQKILLGAILLAGFLGRMGYAWFYPQWGPDYSIPSPDQYARLAQTLLDHGALLNQEGKVTPEREPGYPIFLAAIFFLSRSYRFAQFAQCLLATLSLWLIFLLGKQLLGHRPALTAACIAAFYPQFIYYAGLLYRETFMVFLVLVGFISLVHACRRPSALSYLASGLLQALAPLTNTALLPFGLAAAPLGIFWLHRNAPGRGKWICSYLAGFIFLYGLWVARNFYHFHTLILGATTGGGGNLYIYQVVPPELAGTSSQHEFYQRDPVSRRATLLTEIERDKYLYREGLKKIAERPLPFLRLCLQRFFKLWRIYPYPRDYAHNYQWLKLISLATDGWIIPLGLLGMILIRLKTPELIHFYLFMLSTSAVYSVFWAMMRYRLPMMAPMILFCAYTLSWMWEKRSHEH